MTILADISLVPKGHPYLLDFEVDHPTNSIVNVVSGDSFATLVKGLEKADLKLLTKKAGWKFNWRQEMANPERELYKLVIDGSEMVPEVIQGVISLASGPDHVFMYLLENAPFNIGKDKVYTGVAGNLVAFACRQSFERGFDGFVVFESKTKLIQHYQFSLGAKHLFGQRMAIETQAARVPANRYFKNDPRWDT